MQARAENLIEIDERFDGLILPNYSLPQFLLKMTRRRTPLLRIQFFIFPVGRLRCCCHNISFTVATRTNRTAGSRSFPRGSASSLPFRAPLSCNPLAYVWRTVFDLHASLFALSEKADRLSVQQGPSGPGRSGGLSFLR